MIKIVIIKNELDQITSITVKGHANYSENGKDIVCAGVSAVMVGGASAIINQKNFNIIIQDGLTIIEKKEEYSHDDEIVLKTIYTQLKCIEESYPKFVKIQIEKD